MKPLPILVSIPHGGTQIPAQVMDNLLLDQQSVVYDGDTWSDQLYQFETRVLHTALMPVARAVLDVNRLKTTISEDGVVKTHSILRTPIWAQPLSVSEVQTLIHDYYDPYYQDLVTQTKVLKPWLGLDCHSMLPEDPFDQSKPQRPLFCISNRGNHLGETSEGLITAPAKWMRLLKESFEVVFGLGTVNINDPFKGGALIEQMHALTGIPWIQLEVNRKLYVPDQTVLPSKPEGPWLLQLITLRENIFQALSNFIKAIEHKKIL